MFLTQLYVLLLCYKQPRHVINKMCWFWVIGPPPHRCFVLAETWVALSPARVWQCECVHWSCYYNFSLVYTSKQKAYLPLALPLAQNHSQLSKGGDTMLGSKHWRRCASHCHTCTNWNPWNHCYRSLDDGKVMIRWWEEWGESKGESVSVRPVCEGRGWVRGRPPEPYWVAVWWPLAPLRCTAATVYSRYNGGRLHQPIIITRTRSSSGHWKENWCCFSHDFVTLLPSPNGYPLLMLFWRKCLCQWPVYIATHCHAEQSASVQRPLATPPLSHHILARPRPPALRDEDHSLQLLQTIQQRKPME